MPMSPNQPSGSIGLLGVARGLAAFLGGFSLLNLLGELRYPGFDANLWWIDLRLLPTWSASCLLGFTAVLLIAYALRPRMAGPRYVATVGGTLVPLILALKDAAQFWVLLVASQIHAGFPLPFSLLVGLSLAIVLAAQLTCRNTPARWDTTAVGLLTVAVCLFIFPLAQMFCFGRTDYRRPADAIVVFGARAYSDGTASVALADRVRTGCDLYRTGLAPRIIFSGGPGDGRFHETDVCRTVAMREGVPDRAILLDRQGLNTQATVTHTLELLDRMGARRVLVVSHFYHLPRIKMTYQRAGREVYTVPARESYVLRQMPHYMLREIAALWVYYLRPLIP